MAITGTGIQAMVSDWLDTPVNGYLGSGYGSDTRALLQRPQSDSAPDEYLRKLRVDVPVLDALPAGAVNLYAVSTPPDRLDLVIDVAGQAIAVPSR